MHGALEPEGVYLKRHTAPTGPARAFAQREAGSADYTARGGGGGPAFHPGGAGLTAPSQSSAQS